MKKLLALLMTGTILLTGCGKTQAYDTTAKETVKETETAKETADTTKDEGVDPKTVEKVNAKITVKDYGTIELELYPSKAPQTVSNFTSLARDGFYDGLTFHRVIDGFMIQGGDPDGTGTGGPGYSIKGEFSSNGVENDIKHLRGVISMARKSSPKDSAGSQFFIMHQDAPHLDGEYAAFGKVTSGMDIVDKIVKVEKDKNGKPNTSVIMEKVEIEGEILKQPEKIQK